MQPSFTAAMVTAFALSAGVSGVGSRSGLRSAGLALQRSTSATVFAYGPMRAQPASRGAQLRAARTTFRYMVWARSEDAPLIRAGPGKRNQMPIATANGTDLFYEVSGTSGDPVVLVHGSWVDHHDWDAVALLLARSHRVLAYDRRGHSRSPRPATQGSVREDADDLAALLERVGLAPAHVVANSFGGIVALRLAVTRPDLVRSLAVHEPPLFSLVAGDPAAAGALTEIQKHAVAVLGLIGEGDGRAAAELFVETIALGPGSWAMIPEPVRAVAAANAKTFEDEVQDPEWTNVDLAGAASFSRLRPVLITQGDRSPPLFAAVAARLAMAMPQARRHTFPGMGHAPHLTHPAEYARVVEGFLG